MKYITILISFLFSVLMLDAQDLGEKMPAFELKDRDGEVFKSSGLEGKYVLIDFWASWCGPCHKKFPELKELYNEFHGKGLEIVGISTDSNQKYWLNHLKGLGLPWIQLLDEQGEESVSGLFGVKAVPALFLVGPDGKIIARDPDHNTIRKLITATE